MPEEVESKLVANWRQAHKFWSVQLSVFWAIVTGLWMALPAFQSFVTPIQFAGLCIVFTIAIFIARVTKQPGVTDG